MNIEINTLIEKSRFSQKYLDKINNAEINKIIKLIEKNILEDNFNHKICEMIVKETGFGNIEDKIYKNKYKTVNLIKDIIKIKTNYPKFDKKKKIYEILKPIGVICGVTPSTNPIATALNYIINSIKCRNSVIICPNPRSYNVSSYLISQIKKIFDKNKIPKDIINIVPKEIIRSDDLISLFNKCDKNIVTGNKNFIDKVKKSNKPFLTFGVGNVPIIVNKDANIKFAASSICRSKSFDNSTSCSSDSVLLVHENIYSIFINQLLKNNFFLLNEIQKKKLDEIFFKKGMINPKIIGKSASEVLENLDIKNNHAKVLVYEKRKFEKNHYIFNEKILPLVGLLKFKKISEAMLIAKNILQVNGMGHSAGIYTKNTKDIINISKFLDVSRIIVNQPHSQSAGGSLNNSLNTTLSLGCGTWGNSQINHNLNFHDFCNKTTVALRLKQ